MNTDKLENETKQELPQKTPDELSGLHIEAKLKIFDPDTQEIFIEGRG